MYEFSINERSLFPSQLEIFAVYIAYNTKELFAPPTSKKVKRSGVGSKCFRNKLKNIITHGMTIPVVNIF